MNDNYHIKSVIIRSYTSAESIKNSKMTNIALQRSLEGSQMQLSGY